jgi:alkylation response protein AidB-like acyl-CoA dehydrogenase
LADAYTPLLKLFSREYANQNAYDALQIHGGSGFMKEYPNERMYRDARILTIYEGTSQLQVVAAIRGVTTGAYLNRIREYEKTPVKSEHEPLKQRLVAMAAQYEEAVKLVTDKNDAEFTDFHARRLVEMAGHIVMGYLLLLDAQRCSDFEQSAAVFIARGQAWNSGHFSFIEHFELDHLAAYSVKS